ncbi:MAG: hypothetical protein ABI629_05405 [bacterium]
MQDRELIRMAAFKLQETARRLGSLVRESDSQEVRRHLKALADELLASEAQLKRLLELEAPKAAGGTTSAWKGRTTRAVG